MDVPGYVAAFNKRREELKEAFLKDDNPFSYIENHTLAADQAIVSIAQSNKLPERTCLVALGGYGRRELFPYSDIDVLFLLPEGVKDNELHQIEAVLSALWELGLTVGYSVRSIEECLQQAKEDITAETAMLESRYLYGDKKLYNDYLSALRKHLDYLTFFRKKFVEQQQRHLKYQDSSNTLEPNIKESPGGLRDLNLISWILKAYNITIQKEAREDSPLLTELEKKAIFKAAATLFWLRMHVHLLVKRHEDRLIFEIQEELAKTLGVKPVEQRLASEVLMQRFYRQAITIRNLNAVILQAAIEKVSPSDLQEGQAIEEGFGIRGETLTVDSADYYKKGPYAFVLPFYLRIKYPQITKFSTRIYRSFAKLDEYDAQDFLNDQRAKELFLKIIKAKTGVYHTLREMSRWGVLSKLLPAFAKIVGQMQHDLFHAYTVDHHIILALRYLRHFTRLENAHEMPLCTDLMMGLKKNWRVVVAMLFHDVGKGSNRDHSIVGAEEVRKFGETYGLAKEDIDYISFLVREHLTMSYVAQKQDISDPDVVEQFAAKVKELDKLTGLYLLTVSDIRATNPVIWNGWKARLLEQLFYSTARHLKGESLSKATLVDKRRSEVLRKTTLDQQSKEKLSRFWEDFDVAYFMRHSESTILWHAEVLLNQIDKKNSFVATRKTEDVANGHEVLILTQDKPELFARIVSSFQKLDLSIMEARIHTGNSGRVLDTFMVVDDESRPDIEADLKELEKDLAQKLDTDIPLEPLAKGRQSRQSKYFPITPMVQIRPDANGKQYLLSIVASDRRGLLASISRVLIKFRINLVTARISTLGERVEDVFLIESPRLKEAPIVAEFETELLKILYVPAEQNPYRRKGS